VVLNVHFYNVYYDLLYLLENAVLVGVLGLAALTSSGGWRRLYLHFLSASVLYGVGSQFLDRASANGTYYSGSLYDVPLIGTLSWMAGAAMSAREWDLQSRDFNFNLRWRKVIPQLAMLAILSLPVLGLWVVLVDPSAPASREFRVFTVLGAMLLLGGFVFLRQYFQDQALMSLLQESRRGYESQKRLQTQLVQKEKLASLGNLVAGAAQEIVHPLPAVMSYSEQLWAQERLTSEQNTLLRKIVNQARRTRDLVADLLSFAQQTPGEKSLVDLGVLLQRATQMLESRRQSTVSGFC
jgi:signal transduction histidine kinase